MLRKTVVILAMLLSSMATQVFALGLGSVSVESSLNQPLRVRIEVLQLGDTRLQDVSVQMASADDFVRFDIERIGFLSNIRFSIEAAADGNYVILTSNQIVREPYLSFILDTRWPNGRLLSEHTILLDLPVFDDQQAAPNVRQPISPVLRAPDTAPTQPFVEPAVQDVAPPVSTPVTPPALTTPPAIEPAAPTPEPAAPIPEPVQEPAEELTTPPTELAVEPEPEPEPVIEQPEPVIEQPEPAEEPVVAAVEPEPEPEPVEDAPLDASEAPDPADAEPETIETGDTDTLSDIALQVRPNTSVSMQQTMVAIQRMNPDAFVDGNINRMRSGQVLRVPELADIEAVDAREAIDEVNRQNQVAAEVDVQPLAAPADATPVQDDQPSGQLSVVTSDPDAIDASSGASELDDAENTELDQRIAELETQLALRQEEADRARIQREELDLRLDELESQITAAEEIIRLQDIQLAQLQASLAEAAAEAEAAAAQQAAIAAAETAAAEPVARPSSLFDDVLRILTGNTLMMIFGVILIILLLVVLLVRRNRSAKADAGELDELAEKEFDASGDEDEDVGKASVDDDLDSELDDIIGGNVEQDELLPDDELTAEVDELTADVDVIEQASALIEDKQLDQAATMLQAAIEEQPGDADLRLKLLEVYAEQNELSAFEVQADELASLNDPGTESKVDALREKFTGAEPVMEEESITFDEDETEETLELEDDTDESSSFLDDLGIDMDAFDESEEPAQEAAEESGLSIEEEAPEQEAELQLDEELQLEEEPGPTVEETAVEQQPELDDLESFDSDEMGMTFDLAGGDDAATADAGDESSDEASDEAVPGLDDIEFETETETEPEAEVDEQQDEGASAADEAEATDNAVDFDFDKDEIGADESEEKTEDLETFDFDLDSNSTATVIEKPEADEQQDEPQAAGMELEDADTAEEEEETTEAEGDDFDFDLDEFDVDLKLDDAAEETVEESTEEADAAVDDDDIEIELAEEPEVEEPVAVIEEEDDDLEDLEFLSDEEEVEIESVDDIEEVEMLSDIDEVATKLELAYAYQKMGDVEGAKEILQEVINEGSDAQVKEANELITSIDKSAD